jgi:flavin-dependent dehydrogenase
LDLDVAIVGASSAGLYAAEQLARAGRRVAVFERQLALNHARRTLIITPQLVRALGHLPESAVLHRTPVIEVLSRGAKTCIRLEDPDLIIERRALMEHLAARAEAAGAELCLGHRFESLGPAASGAELRLSRRDGEAVRVQAQVVIGADGVFSSVGAAAGIVRPPLVQIIQAEVDLPAGWNPEVTRVWFDAAETRYFYWLIPESATRGALGVIANDASSTRGLLDRFLARQGLKPLAYQASHVAMHHPSLRPWGVVGSAPVLLVGDAAGQVKVTTVGGTVSGFYGAAAAVQAILEPTSMGRALRSIKRELDLHWWMRAVLERLDNAGYDQLVTNISPAVQQFLGQRNRDAMAGAIWRLPLLRPQLIGLGLAALRGNRSAPATLLPEPPSVSE